MGAKDYPGMQAIPINRDQKLQTISDCASCLRGLDIV